MPAALRLLAFANACALLASTFAFVNPAFRPHGTSDDRLRGLCTRTTRSALQLQMDADGRHDVLLSRSGFARRTMAVKLYSRMLNRISGQALSQTPGLQEVTEGESASPSGLQPALGLQGHSEGVLGATSGKTKEAKAKLPPKQRKVVQGGLRNQTQPGKEKKAVTAKGDEELAVAFGAFADCLLRTKGRVRFSTINAAFRHEFPTLASYDKLNNATLGRRISSWYERTTGTPLVRTSQGVLLNVSLINPSYTSTDLRSLRAAQMLFEPEMRNKFQTLGLSLTEANLDILAAPATKGPPQPDAPAARSGSQKRVQVIKNGDGKIIKVVRRADPVKGVKEKTLFDLSDTLRTKQAAKDAARAARRPAGKAAVAANSKLDELGQAIAVCIESFANTMLVPAGNATFSDVSRAFRQEFPLLRSQERCPDPLLGKRIYDWYLAKYGVAVARRKRKEDLSVSRAAIPYTNLGLRDPAAAAGVDTVQVNQAKVALRKALGMEGVGMMVRRVGPDFTVFTIVPGSPAAVNGRIQIGDVLEAVDGRAVHGLSTQELADLVLGPRGTLVRLLLRGAPDARGGGGEARREEVVLKRNDVAVEAREIAGLESADLARRLLTNALQS